MIYLLIYLLIGLLITWYADYKGLFPKSSSKNIMIILMVTLWLPHVLMLFKK